jgi:molybdenum cofactor cytidylyltransferase
VTVAAVILAAGGGRRYAGDGHKLRARLRGRPLVAHAVAHAVAAGLDEVVVVTGAVDLDDLLGPASGAWTPAAGPTLIPNPRWAEGQATSLQVAVAHARAAHHHALVVGLGDQPFVGAQAWRAVAACDAPVAVATFEGARRPPVRLAAAVWPLLPTTGDEGARGLLRSRPDLVSEVPCQGRPVDIDTLEDLARWS